MLNNDKKYKFLIAIIFLNLLVLILTAILNRKKCNYIYNNIDNEKGYAEKCMASDYGLICYKNNGIIKVKEFNISCVDKESE